MSYAREVKLTSHKRPFLVSTLCAATVSAALVTALLVLEPSNQDLRDAATVVTIFVIAFPILFMGFVVSATILGPLLVSLLEMVGLRPALICLIAGFVSGAIGLAAFVLVIGILTLESPTGLVPLLLIGGASGAVGGTIFWWQASRRQGSILETGDSR